MAVAMLAANAGCARFTLPVDPVGPLAIVSHSRDAEGERFTPMWFGDRLVVDVESPSGIGHATLRPGWGVWPGQLTFRLHLRGLEGFEARGAKEFQTSIAEKPLTAPAVVDIPNDVFEGAPTLEVRWADFYR